MQWKPNTTVAAIIEENRRFLMVEEETGDGIRINQPAGHLEAGESLIQGVIRETAEETAYRFVPEFILGIYQWRHEVKDITYMRFAFVGKAIDHDPSRPLDHGILRAIWMPLEEIREKSEIHRSPQVMRCIEDYLSGQRYPLELVTHL